MLLKYLDLHNKILRDAADPDEVAAELLKNGYYVVGVNSHNDGYEVKNKEHFYRFFETHFELFEKKGLLMLPAVELKIRDGNYAALADLITEFSCRFIPVNHKGEKYHVPFMIFLHGGHRKANEIGVEQKNLDLLCHPLKDGGTFTRDLAQQAAKNNVGIETNYREYIISENKDEHLNREKELINTCHKEGNKIFLFSATIKEEELVHIKKLIEYGNRLYENLIKESMENVHELLTEKYGTLLKKTGFSLERMKERHKIRQ